MVPAAANAWLANKRIASGRQPLSSIIPLGPVGFCPSSRPNPSMRLVDLAVGGDASLTVAAV